MSIVPFLQLGPLPSKFLVARLIADKKSYQSTVVLFYATFINPMTPVLRILKIICLLQTQIKLTNLLMMLVLPTPRSPITIAFDVFKL